MDKFVLRVEGVNFGACLEDTNDLSVVRGASLLLDQVADPVANALSAALGVKLSPVWSGGSKAVFDFAAPPEKAASVEAAARAALSQDPWKHMTWVLDMVSGALPEDAAEARNRSRQFRQWTVADCQVPGAWRQDTLDGVRPADPSGTDPKGPLSPASVARRTYGREQRRAFFRERAGDVLPEGIVFCEDFADIVARAPSGLSKSAQSKLAVLHFDGDGFGDAARKMRDPAGFAEQIGNLSKKLLHGLVIEAFRQEAQDGNEPATCLRMEVLMWGGDDITLVVPAWRALATIEAFYRNVQGWSVGNLPLGFTGAAVVANYKAPIRRLKSLASEAVDLAKAAQARGSFSIDIFESASPAEDGLAAHRSRVHPGIVTKAFGFPGAEAATLVEQMARNIAEAGNSFPSRARLHAYLGRECPETELVAELQRDLGRVQGVAEDSRDDELGALRLPSLPESGRSLGADLRLTLDLWDYVPEQPR